MDMVAQPLDGTHDFLTEPIDAYVEGDWVKADGTTLGADDGSGVAIAMAILQSKTLSLGPIEALFTVNEEDGMDGALGLQSGRAAGRHPDQPGLGEPKALSTSAARGATTAMSTPATPRSRRRPPPQRTP